ncbi:hypothetical protein PAMA_015443 [Pampus argenteus]
MACGATLKRSMEFEALLSPQSPKRRRCNPLPGTPSTPSPQRCNLRPPVDSPTHSMSPQAMGGEHRLTPEQIFQNLRQEYSRIQRRRQLEGAFNQSEACSSSDAPSPSSSINAPSSPPGASRKDQPSFTLKQVSYLCERLLKDHEEKIREEYEQILNTKLAGNHHSSFKNKKNLSTLTAHFDSTYSKCAVQKHCAPFFMSIFSHHNSNSNAWFPLTDLIYASRCRDEDIV